MHPRLPGSLDSDASSKIFVKHGEKYIFIITTEVCRCRQARDTPGPVCCAQGLAAGPCPVRRRVLAGRSGLRLGPILGSVSWACQCCEAFL